ncbi:MAG: hypothetical protein LBI69_04670 [Puniceicoccales bacterium]|jgi:guanylate kinase|nr:hypothetical protein [Puniceicoccales bacterium]
MVGICNEISDQCAPLVLIISGPTGAGKTTLCHGLIAKFPKHIAAAVTTTTRLPRVGEVDGVDYYFTSKEAFCQRIAEGKFLEYSTVHNDHFYGISDEEISRHFSSGRDILLNMNVDGAMKLKQLSKSRSSAIFYCRVITIFLLPPPMDEVMRRIQMRGPMSIEEWERRQKSIHSEMSMAQFYDYSIQPDTREKMVDYLLNIYKNARNDIS